MKCHSLHLWLVATNFLGSSLPAVTAALRGGTADAPHAPRALQRSIRCVGGLVDVQDAHSTLGDDAQFSGHRYASCEASDGKSYRLNGASDAVEAEIAASMTRVGFAGEMPELLLPEGSAVNEATGAIDLPAGGREVAFGDAPAGFGGPPRPRPPPPGAGRRGRRGLAVTGVRSVLVVRVVAADVATTASAGRLSDAVFGNGAEGGAADPVTLRSQYAACSFDKLDFVEAADRDGVDPSNPIRKGTITVTVPSAVAAGDSVISNEIVSALNAQFDVSSPSALADHVMMCMPPGAMGGIAYANIYSWRSVYSDNWCTYLSAQLHEVGHNLGLAHSNEGGNYQDTSGMMGFSYSQDNGPLMCFNGPKSWQLGWYATRQHVFELADDVWNGRLIGQVDYDNQGAAGTDVVLLKLNTDTDTDYYVSFNRKLGANIGTKEGGDQVLIGRVGKEGESYAESEKIATKGAGQSHTFVNFDDSGADLTITVDAIDLGADPAYAQITVFSDVTCTLDSDCDDGNPCNGLETCDVLDGACIPGVPKGPEEVCCGDGVCEADETFRTCPVDGCVYDCGADCRTLLTTFDGGNAASGNIFTIRAVEDIVVTGFGVNSRNSGSATAKVWDRVGGYDGVEEDPSAWSLIMNEGFVGAGTDEESPLPDFEVPIFIPAGTLRSFFLFTTNGVRYTNGLLEGDVWQTDGDDIIFYQGKGVGGELGTTAIYSPRVWNGIIRYGLASATPETPAPTPSPTTPNPTTANPTTANPTTANPTTANPTIANPTSPNRMLYCGSPGKDKCSTLGGDVVQAGMNEPNAVRCCTTTPLPRWPSKCKNKPTPLVYSRSQIPDCNDGKTFQEAVEICAAVGSRLCSGEEMLNGCAKSTGCQFNKRLVWGCNPLNDACQKSAECCTGNCDDGTCIPPPRSSPRVGKARESNS